MAQHSTTQRFGRKQRYYLSDGHSSSSQITVLAAASHGAVEYVLTGEPIMRIVHSTCADSLMVRMVSGAYYL